MEPLQDSDAPTGPGHGLAPGLAQPTVKRHPNLVEQVIQLLQGYISEHQLSPGDRLPSERDLGLQFGVSRTVVREAVRSLVGKGRIEVQNGAGLRVATVGAATVRETFSLYLQGRPVDANALNQVRRLLEVETAGLAAEHASHADVREMSSLCDAMQQALKSDVEQAAEIDLAFHLAIARATGNELFPVLLDSVGEAALELRRRNLASGAGSQALKMHRAILKCIRSHDREGARQAMSAHLHEVFTHHQETSTS